MPRYNLLKLRPLMYENASNYGKHLARTRQDISDSDSSRSRIRRSYDLERDAITRTGKCRMMGLKVSLNLERTRGLQAREIFARAPDIERTDLKQQSWRQTEYR